MSSYGLHHGLEVFKPKKGLAGMPMATQMGVLGEQPGCRTSTSACRRSMLTTLSPVPPLFCQVGPHAAMVRDCPALLRALGQH